MIRMDIQLNRTFRYKINTATDHPPVRYFRIDTDSAIVELQFMLLFAASVKAIHSQFKLISPTLA